jgi:lysophospholipase L1-like esterase
VSAKTKIIFNVLAIFLTSAVFTELALYQHNNLSNNGRWESTKISLEKGVVGAVAFFTSFPTLSGNHLNLGTWHGLNEITFKSPMNPSEVSFKFLLEEKTYLVFEYNRTDLGFSGIRLSRSPSFGSLQFHATLSGKFETKRTIENVEIKNGWNFLKARFNSGSISFFLNDTLVFTDLSQPVPNQKIGFRSSTGATLIDDISIIETDGNSISESFRNTKNYFPVFLALLAAFSIFAFLTGRRARLSESLLLVCSIGFGGIITYGTDFLWLSKLYPRPGSRISQLLHYQNSSNFKNNMEFEPAILERISKNYQPVHKKFRILFIGSSQTWGAGAARDGDTIPQRVEDFLNKTHFGNVECINTGISGARSKELFEKYRDNWVNLHPNMVVINLSNNDAPTEAFKINLENFAQLNKQRKIKTIFVLEPNYLDLINGHLPINHETMKAVAKAHNLHVIDLHNYMIKHSDDGLMWWDVVHMTSFGQKVAAEGIVESVAEQNLIASQF